MFKCPVCGFLSESYPEITHHIQEEHPDKKVSSIPSVPTPLRRLVAEGTPESSVLVQDPEYELLVRIVKEIVPRLESEDLDEIASLIRRAKKRRKKEVTAETEHILTP